MTRRLLATFHGPEGEKTKIYRDSEWDEFVVQFYDHRGVHLDASDYHTTSRQDADHVAGAEHPDWISV